MKNSRGIVQLNVKLWFAIVFMVFLSCNFHAQETSETKYESIHSTFNEAYGVDYEHISFPLLSGLN